MVQQKKVHVFTNDIGEQVMVVVDHDFRQKPDMYLSRARVLGATHRQTRWANMDERTRVCLHDFADIPNSIAPVIELFGSAYKMVSGTQTIIAYASAFPRSVIDNHFSYVIV